MFCLEILLLHLYHTSRSEGRTFITNQFLFGPGDDVTEFGLYIIKEKEFGDTVFVKVESGLKVF